MYYILFLEKRTQLHYDKVGDSGTVLLSPLSWDGRDMVTKEPSQCHHCPHKNVRHPGIRLERTKIQGDNGFRISLKRMYVYECPDCGARWESETQDYKPWELTK